MGTAPKTELIARATFYTIFAPSLKRWTRSGVEAHAWHCLQACTALRHTMKHTPERGLVDQGRKWKPDLKRCMHGGGGPMFGHCSVGIACKHAHEDTQCNTPKGGLVNESQSCVLCNVCPFFEKMLALGGGGSCLGTAPKTGLVARATFYTLFAPSLKRWTRSGVEARALLASMRCMKTHNEIHTGRRACGQKMEMEARATFYAMFAPSLKRCMHSGVGAHVRALQRGHCLKHAHEDTQCNTHRKEGLWTKAGNESQSYVLCNV